MEPVRGPRNRRVAAAARLHRARERRDTGRTVIEGPNLLDEAMRAGVRPDVVFALPDDADTAALARRHELDLLLVDEAALQRVAGTDNPRGPVAVIEVPATGNLGRRPAIIAWGLADPGNVGTLIRTAAAFGWDFGHLAGTADPWSPKVLRSGAGGHFRISIAPVTGLEEIAAAGLIPAATVVAGGVPVAAAPPGRYAVLVGEEAAGLPDGIADAAGLRLTIPMPGGMESLNAAVAAAIVVYELSKRPPPGAKDGV